MRKDQNATFNVVEVAGKMHKNRRGDVIQVGLVEIGDGRLIDIREHYCPEGESSYRGTKKGVCVTPRCLDELITLLERARKLATDRGWLGHEGQARKVT